MRAIARAAPGRVTCQPPAGCGVTCRSFRELISTPFPNGTFLFSIGVQYQFLTENALLSNGNVKQLSLLEFQRLRQPGPADVVAAADSVIEDLALTPPIDPAVVASYLDVSRIEETDLDVAGCLICEGRNITIKVRASDAETRQRFTIFHECVHTFFRGFELKPRYRCAPSAIPGQHNGLEAMCDQGASSLLLPQEYLKADLASADFGIGTLRYVAQTYEASLEASGHRIVDLAPYSTMFVVLEENIKPSQRGNPRAEPRLRVRTARHQGDWPFILPHKSVSIESPLGRAMQGELVHEHTTLDEISRNPVPGVEVSARLLPYNGRKRVLALYRRRT